MLLTIVEAVIDLSPHLTNEGVKTVTTEKVIFGGRPFWKVRKKHNPNLNWDRTDIFFIVEDVIMEK